MKTNEQFSSLFSDRIEWFLDDEKLITKYNVVGRFITKFSAKGLTGRNLYFKLFNQNGALISKSFILKEPE